jgi:predicted methyltransferase MtxX (methanogen marker protein 4)
MKILEIFNSMAKDKFANIGIGLGMSKSHNIKILNACLQFLKDYKSKIYLFGHETDIEDLKKDIEDIEKSPHFVIVESEEPEKESIHLLNDEVLNSLIRGSLNSSKFLEEVKNQLEIDELSRLALLETSIGVQFFFGPVGIDECNSLEKKKIFLENALKEFEKLNIEPIISILSGGRKGDFGRDDYVDETIKSAQEIVELFNKKNPKIMIFNDEILIEKAIENQSNLIIAPDGISGNLIYRTLVHLGGGKAYGAIYMKIGRTIIDTSRVGNLSEIHGALILKK